MVGSISKRTTNRLSEAKLPTWLKIAEVRKKLHDGGGMYLIVTTPGAGSWRMEYRFAGKERASPFGTYPSVSLKAARDERAAKALLREAAIRSASGA